MELIITVAIVTVMVDDLLQRSVLQKHCSSCVDIVLQPSTVAAEHSLEYTEMYKMLIRRRNTILEPLKVCYFISLVHQLTLFHSQVCQLCSWTNI